MNHVNVCVLVFPKCIPLNVLFSSYFLNVFPNIPPSPPVTGPPRAGQTIPDPSQPRTEGQPVAVPGRLAALLLRDIPYPRKLRTHEIKIQVRPCILISCILISCILISCPRILISLVLNVMYLIFIRP